jgi:hypothetical protein
MRPEWRPARRTPTVIMHFESLWTAHVAATVAMAGVIWVVQLAIYPLFFAIGPREFPAYHRRYTLRIGAVVVPLMAAETATAAAGWFAGWRGPAFSASLGLLAVTWVSTFAMQVPLHRKLAGGFDAANHRRLVVTNWVRTLAWTLRAGLVLAFTPW